MASRTTLTEDEVAFVQAQRVAYLATSDADGHPYVVPICYAFNGTHFYTPLDEKPKRTADNKMRRVRNIEERHEASLLFDQYSDDWSKLAWVLVHGRADLLRPEEPGHTEALVLLRERYWQYRTMELEIRPIIVITPDHITSWGPALDRRASIKKDDPYP